MKDWPTSETGRVAATAARLAEVLVELGPAFERRVSDYQRTRLPSFTEGGPRSREDVSASKQERQLTKDCEQVSQSLRMVNDVMADMIERILRVTSVDQGGDICSRCGNRINPKTDRPKFWDGKEPMHSACHSARWRQENGRKKAS